jgi:hypothetical protein
MLRTLTFSLVLLHFGAAQLSAQIIFMGGTYSQNFDTLASTGSSNPWVNNVTLAGWYSTRTSYEADDGTGNTGNLYSYGGGTTNPITDRALGSITSNPLPNITYGIQIFNATGSTIESFDLSYFGEQWRNSGGNTGNSLVFSYLVTTSPLNELTGTGYTAVPSLDFNSILVGSPATSLDGNAPQNRTLISGTVSSLGWDPGEFLWLRWVDNKLPGTPNNGLALDDLAFTAVPEVGPIALVLVLGAGAFAFRNLRQKTPTTAEGEVAVAEQANLDAPTAGEVCPVVVV